MDLISRAWLKEAIHNFFNDLIHKVTEEDIQAYIEATPSAFKGMTYGEVMKTVLGIKDEQIEEAKYLICIYPKGNHHDPFMAVKREVWNSPYKEMSVIFGTVGASE